MTTAAIIVAAGRGIRTGVERPKQYCPIGSETMLYRTLKVFDAVPWITHIRVVISSEHEDLYRESVPDWPNRPAPVAGGATRQASVLAGLEALAETNPDHVLIHDAARPFITTGLIELVSDGIEETGAVLPVLELADSIKTIDADGHVADNPDRSLYRAAQTPQGFRFAAILDAHRRAAADDSVGFTDDASIASWAGHKVSTVEGDVANIKVTTERDLMIAAQQSTTGMHAEETRTGQGYDVHRFKPGNGVILCGVDIPHTQSLEGHSDADVAMHALTDAIYGAMAEGDIGRHFPPSDPKWKGAASRVFLEHACGLARQRGRLVSVDVTIICEHPKIGPHAERMRASLAEIMALEADRISIKATTSEGLGFTGREEGIAATAIATVAINRHVRQTS